MHTRLPRTRKQRKVRRNKTQKGGNVVVTARYEKPNPNEDKPRTYYTVDKGRKVYEIVDDFFGSGYVDVYKLIMDKQGNYTRGKRILHIKTKGNMHVYNKLWNKLNESHDKERGRCVIINVGNGKHIFVGHEIYSFTPNEDILLSEFVSPITEEGICFPYLITDNRTYFLRDHVSVPNRVLGVSRFEPKKPYELFYGKEAGWIRRKLINVSKKPFDVKVIDSGL